MRNLLVVWQMRLFEWKYALKNREMVIKKHRKVCMGKKEPVTLWCF